MSMIYVGERKRIRYDAVITAIGTNTPEGRLSSVADWAPSTASIFVAAPDELCRKTGDIKFIGSKHNTPTLHEALTGYKATRSGYGIIAICDTESVLNHPIRLMEYLESRGAGRAWAFHAECGERKLFAVTTPVLVYLIRAVPKDLLFSGTWWSDWISSWLTKNMPIHRYVDVNRFNLINSPKDTDLIPDTDDGGAPAPGDPFYDEPVYVEPSLEGTQDATAINSTATSTQVVGEDTPTEPEPLKTQKKRGRPRKAK